MATELRLNIKSIKIEIFFIFINNLHLTVISVIKQIVSMTKF